MNSSITRTLEKLLANLEILPNDVNSPSERQFQIRQQISSLLLTYPDSVLRNIHPQWVKALLEKCDARDSLSRKLFAVKNMELVETCEISFPPNWTKLPHLHWKILSCLDMRLEQKIPGASLGYCYFSTWSRLEEPLKYTSRKWIACKLPPERAKIFNQHLLDPRKQMNMQRCDRLLKAVVQEVSR